MQEKPERSSMIFVLAQSHSISLDLGFQSPLSDDDYLNFRKSYLAWSELRDKALLNHLFHANRFRVYVPYKPRVFQIAYQILWYYDEVITRDPIGELFSSEPPSDLEDAKQSLIDVVQRLYIFRQSIESGYLLLAGRDALPRPPEKTPDTMQQYVENPHIVKLLDEVLRFQMIDRTDSNGNIWTLFQSRLDYASLIGWHTKGPISAGVMAPAYKDGEEYPETTVDALSERTGMSPEKLLLRARGSYPREVFSVLFSAELATLLNSAVLYDRQADAGILQYSNSTRPEMVRQKMAIETFNITLPFIENIPPVRLMELRESMPSVFIDFRATMTDIIHAANKEHADNAMEWANFEVQRRVAASTQSMESELKALSVRTKIMGIGLPSVMGLGVLAGLQYDLSFASWDPIMFYGSVLAGGLVFAADAASARIRARTSTSLAFLWHARHAG